MIVLQKEAEHLVSTGEDIEREFGTLSLINAFSVTPYLLVAGGSDLASMYQLQKLMDRAAKQ